jgi:ribonuclease J
LNSKNLIYSITPIGGVAEIGSNFTLVRTESEDLIIDCGLLFPYEECFDINFVCPNFKNLNSSRIKSLIITHGHEDHIGSLKIFLDHFPNTKIYLTQFCLSLVKRKLAETNTKFEYELYHSHSILNFNEIDIFPIHVNHSIPETHGLIIRDKKHIWGSLFISDFKVDLHSTHEAPIDLGRIKNLLSECHQTAFFIDSTNITYNGKTASEDELHSDLSQLINSSNRRVFITLFASNVHRLSFIAKSGINADRKIVLMGRSIKNYLEAAFESNIIHEDPSTFYEADQVDVASDRLLILVSGCQGDYLSALRRFSFGEDSKFKPSQDDLIIFSSKVIPGNEKKIYRIYNKLSEFGSNIVTASDSFIHASGHPGKDDIKILLSNFSPNYYFPIHGESYLLRKHYEFISEHFTSIKAHLIYNFSEVEFKTNEIRINEIEKAEPILIHGKNLEIERSQISQRRKMATQGAVFITYQKKSKEIQISLIGLPLFASDLTEQLKSKLIHLIEKELSSREDKYFSDQIKISTRQFFNNFLGYKPVTEIHLV